MIDPPHGFGRDELAILRRLKTPARIQSFLDSEVGYNKELQGPTCRSPRRVLRDRLAHCMEGALFAAAALRVHGFSAPAAGSGGGGDNDRVLAIFRQRGQGTPAQLSSADRSSIPLYCLYRLLREANP